MRFVSTIHTLFEDHVAHKDPGFLRLTFSARVLLNICFSLAASLLFSKTQILWLILPAFLISMSQMDIGFSNQIKRLFITSTLCLFYIFSGTIIGNYPWLYGAVLLLVTNITYLATKANMMRFIMLLMPLFCFIITAGHPASMDAALQRLLPAATGAIIALLTGTLFFPYNSKKVLSRIEHTMAFYFIDYFNFIFLSYLTGNKRMKESMIAYEKLLSLLEAMNQQLVYLKNSALDQRMKHIFDLFAQGYFIARLLHEPSEPDQWLYLKPTLENTRRQLRSLLQSWYNGDITAMQMASDQLLQYKLPHKSNEISSLMIAITKITESVKELATCQPS